MKPEWIIYLGGLIGTIGALIALYGTLRQSQVANTEADSLRVKIENLTQQNERLKNITTGGDSYLKLFFVYVGHERYKMMIQNLGEYPLSECKMWFIDMNGQDKLSSQEAVMKEFDAKKRIIDIGYVSSKGIIEFNDPYFQLDEIQGVYLIVHFSANNGTTTQIIRMKRTKDKWTTANKYIRGKNFDPVVIYDIPSDYPALPDKDDTFNNHY